MSCRCSMYCIVPPHILLKLLESKQSALRDAALKTLLASTRVRTQRALTPGLMAAVNATGGKRRTIYDARGNLSSSGELVRGEGDLESNDAAVNNAYDNLGLTYDFYLEVFERNSLDGRGMRLDGVVHYGEQLNNAFFNGTRMLFGDGDGIMFSGLDRSLDVVAHELTHGVTQFTAGLEYHNQSGALNESVSDVFGSLVKQWHAGEDAEHADWLLGEDVFTPGISADALRSLKAPGTAYNSPEIGSDPQPDHMDRYVNLPDTPFGDNGGVHINSGIPNHAFYRAATAIGGNAWEVAGHIWYDTLVNRVGEFAQFQDFAKATYEGAGSLYGTTEQQIIRDAWEAVGITIDAGPQSVARPRSRRAAGTVDSYGELRTRLDSLTRKVDEIARRLR